MGSDDEKVAQAMAAIEESISRARCGHVNGQVALVMWELGGIALQIGHLLRELSKDLE